MRRQRPPKPPSPRWIAIADRITDAQEWREDKREAKGKPRQRSWGGKRR